MKGYKLGSKGIAGHKLGLCDCCIKYRFLDQFGHCFDCWNKGHCKNSQLSDIPKVLQDSLGIDDDNKHR